MSTSAEVLVVPVNCVGIMGAGLAKAVADRWPSVLPEYREHTFTPASVHWLEPTPERPTLALVATKAHWRQPSQLSWIRIGLEHLVFDLESRDETSIAIPRLGCGRGGLEWSAVAPYLFEAIQPLMNRGVTVS